MIVQALGAVGMRERGVYEDKLVCAPCSLSNEDRRKVLLFLRCYARCKSLLNALRGRPGRVRCEGWVDTVAAMGRARPGPAPHRGVVHDVSRGGASFRTRQ